ncbi:hypothetical protein [Candidatus Enterovibrio escicola]|nr:hypothetical protein [Candidatus Enterovibrio escacola]
MTRTIQGIKVAWIAMKFLVGTNVELKGILMPLKHSKVDDSGLVQVSFNYENGSEWCFKVKLKHEKFAEQ